jgi:hypothetical protein
LACLDCVIFFGEDSLRPAVREYIAHYHAEPNHQGLDNANIAPVPRLASITGRVRCRERLGGMLRYNHGEAAWCRCHHWSRYPPAVAAHQRLRAHAHSYGGRPIGRPRCPPRPHTTRRRA